MSLKPIPEDDHLPIETKIDITIIDQLIQSDKAQIAQIEEKYQQPLDINAEIYSWILQLISHKSKIIKKLHESLAQIQPRRLIQSIVDVREPEETHEASKSFDTIQRTMTYMEEIIHVNQLVKFIKDIANERPLSDTLSDALSDALPDALRNVSYDSVASSDINIPRIPDIFDIKYPVTSMKEYMLEYYRLKALNGRSIIQLENAKTEFVRIVCYTDFTFLVFEENVFKIRRGFETIFVALGIAHEYKNTLAEPSDWVNCIEPTSLYIIMHHYPVLRIQTPDVIYETEECINYSQLNFVVLIFLVYVSQFENLLDTSINFDEVMKKIRSAKTINPR